MEENNLSKGKKSNKKILKGIFIYFLLAIIVAGVYTIYDYNTRPSCGTPSVSVIDTERFYSENFDIVFEKYNKNNEEYIINVNNVENTFWSVDWTEWIKEDIDWEKVYPYINNYVSDRSDAVVKNQGLFLEKNKDCKLIVYITPNKLYFNIDAINSTKDLSRCIECLLDSFVGAGLFEEEEDRLNFLEGFEMAPEELSTVILLYIFRDYKADIKKPIIYLYPEKEIEVDIKLDGANLITTYPEYHNGWTVTAYPDGTLIDKNGRGYNYLYWEGVSNNFIDMSKGFVISKDKYIEFLENKLAEIGLTDKEACDFISYWLPYMNEYEYCQISFQMENYEEQVKLDFSIQLDNELRLFVAFKGLNSFIDIDEQDLSYYKDFKREGFTVVEWGGTFID